MIDPMWKDPPITTFSYDGGGIHGCSGPLEELEMLADPCRQAQQLRPIMTTNEAIDATNPKDLIGIKKVPLGLLPAAGKIYGALAMKNGADKYGPYNWRDKKVRMTIYLDAIERHLLALRDGEDIAEDSKVPHLGHIIACGALLADAVEGDFLIDDRPAKGPAAKVLEKYKVVG